MDDPAFKENRDPLRLFFPASSIHPSIHHSETGSGLVPPSSRSVQALGQEGLRRRGCRCGTTPPPHPQKRKPLTPAGPAVIPPPHPRVHAPRRKGPGDCWPRSPWPGGDPEGWSKLQEHPCTRGVCTRLAGEARGDGQAPTCPGAVRAQVSARCQRVRSGARGPGQSGPGSGAGSRGAGGSGRALPICLDAPGPWAGWLGDYSSRQAPRSARPGPCSRAGGAAVGGAGGIRRRRSLVGAWAGARFWGAAGAQLLGRPGWPW